LKFNSGSSGFYAGFTTANDTRGTNMQVVQQTTNNLYKLTVVDGVFTLYRDGVEINHTSISFSVANCGFCITDWQEDLDVTIKDFKVYPL
jgi:hypothetical protein